MVAFFYCVFKADIYNEELNLSLLKQIMLGRVVLGFSKPLECTNSFPFQVLTSLVFNGRSPMWDSILDRSSQGLLVPLKLSFCSMLPYATSQLGSLFFSTSCFTISFVFFHCSLLWFFLVLFSVYSCLKANLSLTVCFIFCPFR